MKPLLVFTLAASVAGAGAANLVPSTNHANNLNSIPAQRTVASPVPTIPNAIPSGLSSYASTQFNLPSTQTNDGSNSNIIATSLAPTGDKGLNSGQHNNASTSDIVISPDSTNPPNLVSFFPHASEAPDGVHLGKPVTFADASQNVSSYSNLAIKYGKIYGMDPAIIMAIMTIESAGNPHAVSKVGAEGLMQLMPGTAKTYHVTDPFDPEQSIRGGAGYLKDLLNGFKGDLTLMAAGYNAGGGAVQKYNGVPPYPETQTYVQLFNQYYNYYKMTEK